MSAFEVKSTGLGPKETALEAIDTLMGEVVNGGLTKLLIIRIPDDGNMSIQSLNCNHLEVIGALQVNLVGIVNTGIARGKE